MAKPEKKEDKGDSFGLDRIRKLLQLMEKFDVSAINLQNDDESWKIRRGPRVAFAPPSPPAGYAMPMPTAPVPAPVAAGNPAAVAAAAAPTGITINAPTVGTFYSAASPEDAPFVTVGTVVKPDTLICMIESRRVCNQILSERSVRIGEVQSGDGGTWGF